MTAPRTRRHRSQPWVARCGLGAVVGAAIWVAMPWLQHLSFGTRPSVATGFDVGSLVGWLLMGGGLVGVRTVFHDRYGRLGRVAVGLLGVGMVVVAGLLFRPMMVFVGAGLRPVPATGEDPAGLVLTWVFLLGIGLVIAGTGLLGVALWRVDSSFSLTAGVLVTTPVLLLLTIGLRALSVLPTPVGAVLVGTNVAFVPFAVGWALLGWLVYHTTTG